jgi:hypothetical protein
MKSTVHTTLATLFNNTSVQEEEVKAIIDDVQILGGYQILKEQGVIRLAKGMDAMILKQVLP